MVDVGQPAPPCPSAPLAPQWPAQPVQQPISQTQPIQPVYLSQLNCTHFKPEFAGMLDEDTEAHLLRKKWFNGHSSIL